MEMNMIYRSIMDPSRNPLSSLRPQRRFQIMTVLSVMWTTIFVSVAGFWFIWDELILGHLLLATGTLVTASTFKAARARAKTYRDYPRRDGTPRYDDVWGA